MEISRRYPGSSGWRRDAPGPSKPDKLPRVCAGARRLFWRRGADYGDVDRDRRGAARDATGAHYGNGARLACSKRRRLVAGVEHPAGRDRVEAGSAPGTGLQARRAEVIEGEVAVAFPGIVGGEELAAAVDIIALGRPRNVRVVAAQ